MDYSKLIAAILSAQAAHTVGHFNAASDRGIEASLHGQAEHYSNPKNVEQIETYTETLPWRDNSGNLHYGSELRSRKKQSIKNAPLSGPKAVDIHGGGFSMQDEIARAADDPNYSIGNAIIKLAHLLDVPQMLSKDIRENSGGDLKAMKKESGNKEVKGLLALSLLADLYKAKHPESTSSLSFTTLDEGTPGLIWQKRF